MAQEFEVWLKRDEQGGSRPRVFMPEMFAEMMKFDLNKDGHLTKDELPPGQVSLYIGHIDKNNNDALELDEILEFLSIFNNGRGFESNQNDGDRGANRKRPGYFLKNSLAPCCIDSRLPTGLDQLAMESR